MTVHNEPSGYGTLEQQPDGRWQLRFSRTLRHPPEKVWRALTEPEHLAAWFPTTIEGPRHAGAHLNFAFPQGQAPAFEGEFLAYDPPRLMELRWGSDVLRFELQPVETGTELTLLDTFQEHGRAARDGAGWHVCLDALAAHLSGDQAAHTDWAQVHRQYVESFGPEGATIGPPAGM
jgi:uncharacterized protein YndB with AHSA1/START domain